jgi:hypothetical protein
LETEGCSRSDKAVPGAANGNDVVTVLWKHPTPHEQSLAQVDGFLAVPRNHFEMTCKAARLGFTARYWALRHLRIWAAIHRIRDGRSVKDGTENHLVARDKPNSSLSSHSISSSVAENKKDLGETGGV